MPHNPEGEISTVRHVPRESQGTESHGSEHGFSRVNRLRESGSGVSQRAFTGAPAEFFKERQRQWLSFEETEYLDEGFHG